MAVISLGMSQHCGSSVLEEKKRKKNLVLLHRKLLQKDATKQSTEQKVTFSLRDEFKSGTNLVQVTLQSVLVTHLNKYNDNCNIFD